MIFITERNKPEGEVMSRYTQYTNRGYDSISFFRWLVATVAITGSLKSIEMRNIYSLTSYNFWSTILLIGELFDVCHWLRTASFLRVNKTKTQFHWLCRPIFLYFTFPLMFITNPFYECILKPSSNDRTLIQICFEISNLYSLYADK